jgi:hypothetical protein
MPPDKKNQNRALNMASLPFSSSYSTANATGNGNKGMGKFAVFKLPAVYL